MFEMFMEKRSKRVRVKVLNNEGDIAFTYHKNVVEWMPIEGN
jgi:hypothetical protein